MSKFRFSCTSCGACCNTPPFMSVQEAIRLSDVFLAVFEIVTTALPHAGNDQALDHWTNGLTLSRSRKRAITDSLRPRYEKTHNKTTAAQTHGFDVYYTGIATHLTLHPKNVCPALDGKLCGIYDRRPNICHLVPFDPALPQNAQHEILDGLAIETVIGGYECDLGETAPVIYDNGRIKDADAKRYYEAIDKGDPFGRFVAEDYLRNHLANCGIDMDTFHRFALTHNDPESRYVRCSFLPPIEIGVSAEVLTEADAASFYGNQITLIEAELARKNQVSTLSSGEFAKRIALFEQTLAIYRQQHARYGRKRRKAAE